MHHFGVGLFFSHFPRGACTQPSPFFFFCEPCLFFWEGSASRVHGTSRSLTYFQQECLNRKLRSQSGSLPCTLPIPSTKSVPVPWGTSSQSLPSPHRHPGER